MIKQDNTIDLFFLLLREALWLSESEMPKKLSAEMTDRISMMTEEQTVSALVADAIMRNNIKLPRQHLFGMLGLVSRIKLANQQINCELKELVKLPLKDYVVVKGQTIAAVYPNPLLRIPGDIDFMVHDYENAKSVINREWRIELPAKIVDKEYTFEHAGVTYEIHDQLIVFGRKKHQKYWNELMKRPCRFVYIEGGQVPTLSPTINAVYVFVHLFFHFLREGVSLRQLCDWAMILHHYEDEIEREQLSEILNKLDLQKAYCAFGTILVDKFGLPLHEFPFELGGENRKWEEKLLKDIFQSGNFGKLHHQTHKLWRFKLETMCIALRNTLRYYKLCPSEVGGMIPRLVKQNFKIWKEKV